MMRESRPLLVVAGKVLLAGFAHAAGVVLAGLAVTGLGLEVPALPAAPGAGQGLVLVLLGSLAMAAGLAVLARGLAGSRWQRWAILSLFVVLVHGVGTALESRIFTTLGGEWVFFVPNAVGGLVVALVLSLLFASPASSGPGPRTLLARWLRPREAWRFLVALVAFPFFYFAFGMLIAPIVMPHYERLDFLVIPSMPVLLGVLFSRSCLFLLASMTVIAAWSGSRLRLAISLGLAHFVAVGLVGLLQATFFPPVLRWVHGVEILADSLFYAATLAWLFFPRSEEGREQSLQSGREPRVADSPAANTV